jgi:ubiquinone biosynthesis protein COQ4
MDLLAPLRPPLAKLRITRSFLRLFRDPSRLDEVFRIIDTLSDPRSGFATRERKDMIIGAVRRKPGCERLFEDRPLATEKVDLDALLALPEGSLGRTYAVHMRSNRLDPDFYPKLEPIDELKWLSLRMRQVHDIWHVLVNFHVDAIGEVGLQAFTAAQVPALFPPVIVAGGILRSLSLDRLPETTDAVADGFHAGRSARAILTYRWEERWEEPLEELRREVGIPAVASDKPYALRRGPHALAA